jgi:aryl-alcohol dehydrogenase-like predicted oxidoreductase
VLPAASQAGIGVINRSVLLKGSLTKLRHQLPPGLELLRASADKAEQIATNFDTDLPTLAIRFALSNPHISTVLIGTNKIENLTLAVKAIEAGLLPQEIISQLKKLALTDLNQVDPAKWPSLS